MKKILNLSLVTVLLLPSLLNFTGEQAIAQTAIDEDKLNTVNGMPWAGGGLPFSKLVNIQDTLVNSALGKVVIDAHGEDPLSSLIKSPFSGPRPGRFVVVSLWGSKIEGCFAKVVVQTAPADGQATLEQIAPTTIELGIDGQILQLTPSPNSKVRGFSGKYTYTEYENNQNVSYSNTWYMSDTLFAINADAANILRKAQPKEVRVRLTFANGDTKVFPIGKGTVKHWQEAYGFNSACTAPNQP
ncbi:hypothetical protein H6G80_16285 [Nostoc sp. FACHB-87]|uniref:hypothetical protein n=1 Tax=Nostocaceae TaxID=1162 RepID=UPI0016879ADE|nr:MULTISPECIES: hypothetical protein [Nostocaceae]MBD2299436.1 hypothetical protein [Nostoc sp. FACHB-190]MBD2455634.1 hypothetical protein [Nostoc sp. FACHB-87]MBD2477265.1 hypothetical protein [Anabaena sp. FACHB-83]